MQFTKEESIAMKELIEKELPCLRAELSVSGDFKLANHVKWLESSLAEIERDMDGNI